MTKIEALEKTIYNLENKVYQYGWGNYDTCNCGIVARTVLNGRSPKDCGFYNVRPVSTGSPFGNALFSSRTHCISTGIHLPEVFAALKDTGFSHEELSDLEFLKNKEILTKASPLTNIRENYYEMRSNLIKYLRAWVEILKEQEVKSSHKDITKDLAVLPVDEKRDWKIESKQLEQAN